MTDAPAPPGSAPDGTGADEGDSGEGSPPGDAGDRAAGRWRWRLIMIIGGLVLAALAAAEVAFAVLGPVGFGPGPLVVAYSAEAATALSPTSPALIAVPVGARESELTIIDSVQLGGGGGYRAPRLLRVQASRAVSRRARGAQTCGGIWRTVPAFLAACAPGGTAGLSVSGISSASGVAGELAPRPGGGQGLELAIEIGPPPADTGCWMVTKVTIAYQVGRRRYTVNAPESLSGCTSS
jgi:hypothetical protein